MLFRQHQLTGIRDGKISLAFRRWKRPGVKEGSLIKTAIGQVEIVSVTHPSLEDIDEVEARKAGYTGIDELRRFLEEAKDGKIYRIEMRYHSPDPRVALRNRVSLSEQEFLELKSRLERLDRYSTAGAWTLATLQAIRDNPLLVAKHLCKKVGMEREPFKLNVRKLKNLGLTISHEVGYTLSPLGEKFLELLNNSFK